jgi:hypothetical protein
MGFNNNGKIAALLQRLRVPFKIGEVALIGFSAGSTNSVSVSDMNGRANNGTKEGECDGRSEEDQACSSGGCRTG